MAVDLASAASLYGSTAGAPGDMDEVIDPIPGPGTGTGAATRAGVNLDQELDGDPALDEWLESAALGLDEVDEEALAEAMAQDELGDITPDELAQFEADLISGKDAAGADDVELAR
jgi:dsDNA-binding SOS-regulon protein